MPSPAEMRGFFFPFNCHLSESQEDLEMLFLSHVSTCVAGFKGYRDEDFPLRIWAQEEREIDSQRNGSAAPRGRGEC